MNVEDLIAKLHPLKDPTLDVVIKGPDGVPYDFDVEIENIYLEDGEPQFGPGMDLLVVSFESSRECAACTDTLY